MTIAAILVFLIELYAAIGAVFAAWFAWRGAGRLDPVATHGTWGFRLLLVSGAALLWPYLLRRLAGQQGEVVS
jgi:hypothetical protein